MAIHNNEFDIIVFDADKLIRKNYTVEKPVGENGEYTIKYHVDYTKAWDRMFFTKSIKPIYDNALFYQIRDLCNIRLTDDKIKNCLAIRDKIVYVDFESFFKRKDLKDEFCSPEDYNELKNTSNITYDECKIKKMIEQGIYIKFNEKTDEEKFVVLDKSNSMSKKCLIAFVREDIKKDLDIRLNLGIQFKDKIQVCLSKYYAYRGLYLTDALRMENSDLVLNEEKIIIIKDWNYTCKPTKIYTLESGENGDSKEVVKEENKEIKELFDGEGIISPVYRDLIDFSLDLFKNKGKKDEEKAQSFQIRLPFTKGILHTVDFKTFLDDNGLKDKEKIIIKDAFGIERNLRDAEIIMPVSMFKCKKWLTEAVGSEKDPMEFYFEQIKKYHHALYIANTNLSYGRTSKIPLGYQFLNTLKLDSKDLDKYTEETYKLIENPFYYLSVTDNLTEEKGDDSKPLISDANIWKKALLKNPALAHEKKISQELRNTRYYIKRDYAYGRFLVDGEVRILSRDLLEFLIQLLRMEDTDKKNPNIDKLNKKRMFADSFYLPNALKEIRAFHPKENGVKEFNYYALLRNPHLSRLEQYALTPVFGDEIVNLYNKYFGHLHGVIMVGYSSLAPLALGGADFDGDIVKFIYDDSINRAVLSANYKPNGNKKIYYRRTEPIIDIPSVKSKEENVEASIPYKLIKNTFDNKVGKISNRAIAIGHNQYNTKDYEGPTCELCTVLTGQEIDAVKNGKHPKLTSIETKTSNDNAKKVYDYISDFKTIFDMNFEGKNNFKISRSNIKENGDFYEVRKFKEDDEPILMYPKSESLVPSDKYLLGMIPAKFFEMLLAEKNEVNIPQESFFTFLDENWKDDIDNEKRNKVKIIIQNYLRVSSLNKALNKWNRYKKGQKSFAGYLHNILEWQYDIEEFERKWLLVDDVMLELDSLFTNENDVGEAINRLEETGWIYKLPDNKDDALKNILAIKDFPNELKNLPGIVENFGMQGYKLLYYILNDLKNMKLENKTDQDYIASKLESKTECDHIASKMPDDDEKYDADLHEFYNEFYKGLIDASISGMGKRLLEKTIEKIDEIIGREDILNQLKLMYSLTGNADAEIKIDKDSEVFWAYFKPDMLEFVKKSGDKENA